MWVRKVHGVFIDSMQFLNSSLDVLVRNLSSEDFKCLKRAFGNRSERLELVKCKGVYPYDWVDSFKKFDESSLPNKECFFSSLKSREISEEAYLRASRVWNVFVVKTFGEYHLYLTCDVLLLCDVFEKFINSCLE